MAHLILLVDDSRTARAHVRFELEALGHEVVEAIDGTQALSVLQSTIPALVITDVNMGPMDGLTLARKIRAIFPRGTLPILFLTTEAGDDLKAEGKRIGANGWMVKPFNPTRMKSVIDHVLATNSAGGGR